MISKKKLFYVNSRNGTGTTSDFTYQFDISPSDGFTDVCVLQATIPKSYYTIGENSMVLREPGHADIAVSVTSQNYNPATFITEAQTKLDAASLAYGNGWTYTFSFDKQKAKFTITVAGNAGSQPSLVFTDTLYENFGFDPNSTNTFVADNLTSQDVVKFNLEDSLFITSNMAFIPGSQSKMNVLQEVFVNTPDFSSIYFKTPDVNAFSKNLTQNSNSFWFKLCNEDGQGIGLNGQNFNMTILVYRKTPLIDLLTKAAKHYIMDKVQVLTAPKK